MTEEEAKDATAEEPTEEETKEERPIGKLLSLPYSELTDEEIERVIEFRAEVKKNEDALNESLAVLEDEMNESIKNQKESIAKMEEAFFASISMIDAEWNEASTDDEPDEEGEDGQEL